MHTRDILSCRNKKPTVLSFKTENNSVSVSVRIIFVFIYINQFTILNSKECEEKKIMSKSITTGPELKQRSCIIWKSENSPKRVENNTNEN